MEMEVIFPSGSRRRTSRRVIATLKKTYTAFFPGNLFDYYFLDQHYNEQYANDQLFGKAFSIFSGFAIFIACLGLLGLSLFATAQRTKEIGVRKVLGASVVNIVTLLSKDFILLVGIAFVIASPVAWWVMHRWLQDFAYRIDIEWWVFILAGVSGGVDCAGDDQRSGDQGGGGESDQKPSGGVTEPIPSSALGSRKK